MSQESEASESAERTTLPIEQALPIERVNEITAKEGRAGRHYWPIYTMHKWWARCRNDDLKRGRRQYLRRHPARERHRRNRCLFYLLEVTAYSYDDLNKLTRGTDATPERMQDMRLYRMDSGFTLGTWDDEARIAYIRDRVANDEELTDLDRAQLLRYRWERGKSITEYLKQ